VYLSRMSEITEGRVVPFFLFSYLSRLEISLEASRAMNKGGPGRIETKKVGRMLSSLLDEDFL